MAVLDHIGIGVADYERSKAFYEQALAPLGYTLPSGVLRSGGRVRQGRRRPAVVLHRGARGARAGRLHIAFGADSRELVDAFHAAALEAGGTDNGAPGIRWYHDDYYGGYVLDPDGNNVEAVCHKPA